MLVKGSSLLDSTSIGGLNGRACPQGRLDLYESEDVTKVVQTVPLQVISRPSVSSDSAAIVAPEPPNHVSGDTELPKHNPKKYLRRLNPQFSALEGTHVGRAWY